MFLITGHDGFIARNFISQLNNSKIIKIKRNFSKINFIKNKTIKVINFAALYQKKTAFKDLENIINANYIYPIKIIQKLIENNNKVIFFNICSYFQLKKNFKSKSNLYSSIKNSFKEITRYYSKEKKFKCFDIYLYDVFGSGDNRAKLFNIIVNSYKNNSLIKIYNPNSEMVPVHISLVNEILKNYINDQKRPNEIHINHGKKIKVNKLINLAKKIYPDLKIWENKNSKKEKDIFYKKPCKYNYNNNLDYFIKLFFQQYA
jgi:nucleoside-diphosphate-sugar epimerase